MMRSRDRLPNPDFGAARQGTASAVPQSPPRKGASAPEVRFGFANRPGLLTWIREVEGGNGYASQSTTRVHVGLGSVAKVDSVEIRWPSGDTETVSVPVNKITSIEEGKGVVAR